MADRINQFPTKSKLEHTHRPRPDGPNYENETPCFPNGHATRFGLPVIVVLDADGKQLTTKNIGELEEADRRNREQEQALATQRLGDVDRELTVGLRVESRPEQDRREAAAHDLRAAAQVA